MLEKYNLPNKLTVLRMIVAPVYLAVMLIPFEHHFFIGTLVFSVGAISDFLDGKLARKYNQISVFGKLCDPVGDKMLFLAALLVFMKYDLCSPWIVMIIMSREFLVTSLRMVAVEQNIVIAAGIWGKVKTAAQMVSTIVTMLCMSFVPDDKRFITETVATVLLLILTFLTVVSGAKYLYDSLKQIDFKK